MKSGLLAAFALALALLAGLVWWLSQTPPSEAGGSRARAEDESSPALAAPIEVDAPTSELPVSAASAPQQREARGARSYQAPQSATGSLAVRAVWESSGKPAVNVAVRLERMSGHLLLLADSTRTDANGVALFEGVDAGLLIARGDRSGFAMGEVVAGQRAEIELPLEAGLIVTGRVSDAEGRSVSQGEVWILAANRWTVLAECDASGRYRIEDVPRNAELAATARDRSPSDVTTVEGEVGQTLVVDLEVGGPAASVLGQVLDPDERPVKRAVAVLVFEERGFSLFPAAPRRSATCDEEGRFALHSVPLGDCKLIVQTEHFAPEIRELTVKLGERHEVIVNVTPGAELSGVVTHLGKPAAGAQVVVGSPFWHFWGGAVADSRGRYRITGLPSGPQNAAAVVPMDGAQRLEWSAAITDKDLAKAEAELELIAGRAVIWNPQLERKR